MALPFAEQPPRSARRTTGLLHRFRSNDTASTDVTETTRLGLYEVTGSVQSPTITIIFIHGLGGHPVKSWRHRSIPDSFWPQDWLTQEAGLESARICIFGYSADFATTKESIFTIADFSKRLIFDIMTSKMADLPIIFVAHSMGGLVIKKAYMLALQDTKYQQVASSIRQGAMVFLGTPHRGSDPASTLHTILTATVGSKAFVEELKSKSGMITAINEDFRHCAKDLTLWSFYETEPTSIGPGRSAIIVSRDSAVLGYENEGSSHIDGDHRSICKFTSRQDAGYVAIRNLIVHLVGERLVLPEPREPPAYSDEREPQKPLHVRRGSSAVKHISSILGQDDTSNENLLFFRDNRAVSESCSWLYDKESFQWWAESKEQLSGRYLWINGPPATGKSVLMGAVIDQLHSESKICAFFFFRGNNSARRTTRSFILSIIAQMASYSTNFYDRLVEIDNNQSKVSSMPTRVLWQKVLIDALFDTKEESGQPWYWVIDALDEAESPAEIVSLVGKIQSRTPIHILLTSRQSMEIHRGLHTHVAKDRLIDEQLDPSDTKNDMIAHTKQELASLPFDEAEIDKIVAFTVEKSQGIFLWVRFAIEEILATAHTIDGVHEALQAMPSEMTPFLQQILDNMSGMRPVNKKLAKAILQSTVSARRPLKTTELQATLTPIFGQLASLEYTIKQVCPHIIKVDRATSLVQLIHETVREFLLQCLDSDFAVNWQEGNLHLAKVCLDIWSEDIFTSPISRHNHLPRLPHELEAIHPLLSYAATSWFDHVESAVMDNALETSIREFLRNAVLSWIEAVGLLNDPALLTYGAQSLEAFVLQSPLISFADRKLMAGWAVDLIRIAPKYGRNICAFPFSIHKLLPPFCPSKTRIGSQFGAAGDITIVGTGLKNWDDCLAHIAVAQDGQSCRALVCSDNVLAVAVSGRHGAVMMYDAETYQLLREFSHGERVGAINIDSAGDCLATGGLKWVKVWNCKTGELVASLSNSASAQCLAVTFKPDGKSVVFFSSDNVLTTWDFHRDTKKQLQWTRNTQDGKYRGEPWGVTFSKDASQISLAYKGWPLEVWDLTRLEIAGILELANPVGSCFGSSGNEVYGVDQDGTITRFDISSKSILGSQPDAHIVACNPSGTLLATGSYDGVLKVYAADTMELLYKLDKYTDPISGLCFSPDGSRLYDIRSSDCNVWIPEVLFVSVHEDSSVSGTESENSSMNRLPPSVIMESSRSLVNITALVCDSTGSYICCGKSNGTIFIHDTQNGRQLQFLCNHSSTSNVECIAWSDDGCLLASGDDAGRVIIAQLKPLTSSKWECVTKHDIRLDQHLDGTVRQLVFSPDSTRLLVLAQESTRLFLVNDGSNIGARRPHSRLAPPRWLTHPQNNEMLISLTASSAMLFHWASFAILTKPEGIRLNSSSDSLAGGGKTAEIRLHASNDGKHIVMESKTKSGINAVKCSLWDVSSFKEDADRIEESGNWNHLMLDSVVGMYRNQVVFLDRDLWLCSSACGGNNDTARHFYMPLDWLNTSQERLSLMTRMGEFVYARHGEVLIVKRGMKSKHGVI